jgi:uncharacterized damage-inducible protein DinB
MNPYAVFLESRDPVDVLGGTAPELAKWMDAIGPARISEAPARGKWSAREMLCHLADTEIAFAFRLRQALAEDHHTIQPFDQDAWAKVYRPFTADAALAAFAAVRAWNLALIGGMSAADLAKPVIHPERGSMTVQTIVETMAGHDLNHLRQLMAMAA